MRKIIFLMLLIFAFSIGIYSADFVVKDGVLLKCNKDTSFLKLPENITNVSDEAFDDLENVKTLYISKNIKSCEVFPLSIEKIDVDQDNTTYAAKDGVLYNKNFTKIINYPIEKVGASFKIPSSITHIMTILLKSKSPHPWKK